VNKWLTFFHLIGAPRHWLEGQAITLILGLVYGYIPYMILPLFGFLDRIQSSLLEAGRDLGASPAKTFWRVTLPLSKPAIYAGLVIVSLPMFGDYYTNDLLSNSPKTTMIGNLINDTVGSFGQGPKGAVLVLILMILLIIPMMYYLRSTLRAQETR
jgi:spermidine/putrescine transport system permease protein